jgi:predicted nucleic acid-binding protein
LTSSANAYAIDSSAAVAAINEAHEHHSAAIESVRRHRPALAGHATFETYSVLTRLPGSRRLTPEDAALAMSTNFAESCWLSADAHARLVARMPELRIVGGGIYDALVAQAALAHERILLTLDRRAEATYRAVGVAFELLRHN